MMTLVNITVEMNKVILIQNANHAFMTRTPHRGGGISSAGFLNTFFKINTHHGSSLDNN